jgi:hypothetical protein
MKRATCAAMMMAAAVLGVCAGSAVSATAADGSRWIDKSEKVDLKPKFKAGQKAMYRFEQTTNVVQNVPGMSEGMKQDMVQNFDAEMRVKEIAEDGTATLEIEYKTMKLGMTSPMGSMEYDSAKPGADDAGNPIAGAIKPLIGMIVTAKVDKAGQVKETSADTSKLVGPAAQMAKQMLAPEQIKSMFGRIIALKEGPTEVAVGDTWTTVDSMTQGGLKMKISMDKKLEKVEGAAATISMKGTMTSEKDAKDPQSAMAPDVTDAKIDGSAVWDTELGAVKTIESTQTLKLKSQMGDQDVKTVSKITRL